MTKHNEKKTGHDKHRDQLSKNEWEAIIIAYAWKDHKFKKRLLEDPKSALKEIHFPVEKQQVRVIEEQENQWVFVLPSAPAESKKLSEADFSSMAGARHETGESYCYACFTHNGC